MTGDELEKTRVAKREQEQRVRKLVRAYQEVFGVEGNRTPSQDIVMKDMKKRYCYHTPIFQRDASNGFCSLRAALADGQRSVVLNIEQILGTSLSSDGETEGKTQIIK